MPDKAWEPDDPLERRGVSVPEGSLDEMAETLVDEYVRMGFSDEQLRGLFRSPFFGATHAVYRARGDAWVQEIIDRTRERWGQPRFTMQRGTNGNA